MDERPTKRARHADGAATYDERHRHPVRDTPPTGSSTHRPSNRDARSDDRRRQRSHSPRHDRERDRHEGRKRSRSPRSPDRNQAYRDRNPHSRHKDTFRSTREHHASDRRRSYSRSRSRSRSKSPYRNGTTGRTSNAKSRPSNRNHDSKSSTQAASSRAIKREHGDTREMDIDNDDGDDALMKQIMGFSSFKSTQNTKVPGNQIYGVRKEKKSEYRQYMNRVGGFNRPLSPGR